MILIFRTNRLQVRSRVRLAYKGVTISCRREGRRQGPHETQGLRHRRRRCRGLPLQRLIVSERGSGRVSRERGPALLLDVFGVELSSHRP